MLTPVSVLTGFLGSGKTTLLNRMLKSPALAETAVLINEFGEVPIDHLLVRESSESISVLDSGCICCSVQGDLVQALRDLHFKRANKEVPAFKRVIIETTGLADPAPILHTLIEMPIVSARYSLSGVITTVDAVHGNAQLNSRFESVKQAAVADRLVITKPDASSPADLARLRARLLDLNPTARIFAAEMGAVDPENLLDTGLYQPTGKTPDVAKWLNVAALRPLTYSGGAAKLFRPRSSPKSAHDVRIRAFAIQFEEPVVWDGLMDGLSMLLTLRGDQILRVKGVVNAVDSTRPRVIHAVHHTLYPDATLPAWTGPGRSTQLVFIVMD
ncbi:MAG: CobW family GTP-binding protein, partial [Burkholderiales bacterium]